MKRDRMGEVTGDDLAEVFDGDAIDIATPNRSWRWPWLVVGALMGLGVMYLLDPAQGRRRRSRLAESWNRTALPLGKAITSEVRRRSDAVFHGHH